MNWLNNSQPGEAKDQVCEQYVVYEFLSMVPYREVLVSGIMVVSRLVPHSTSLMACLGVPSVGLTW